MPKRKPIRLSVGVTTSPTYATHQEAIMQNVPLLARMILAGEEVERRLAATHTAPSPAHTHHDTPLSASVLEKAAANGQ